MCGQEDQRSTSRLSSRITWTLLCGLALALMALSACSADRATPTRPLTPTADVPPSTPTPTTTTPAQPQAFRSYAYGELLPDMRVPLERASAGEGGWYVVIGSEEGWTQFLSQLGQPPEIWEPVQWEKEVLIGALLGLRQGRGHRITITDLDIDNMNVVAVVSLQAPTVADARSGWITYPFHLVRVPRAELPLGPVTLRFSSEDRLLAEQEVEMMNLSALWLPGEPARYPTPTPILATSTPLPVATSTPVPNLQVVGTVLEAMPEMLRLRIIPADGDWENIDLTEATSIFFQSAQPVTLAQLLPGTTVTVLGYPGQGGAMLAAHIDVMSWAGDGTGFAAYQERGVALATIYDGYVLPLDASAITSARPLSQTLSVTQTNVLTRSGFVVVPGQDRSFSALYGGSLPQLEGLEAPPPQEQDPLFLSADSALHVSQMLFDHVWRSVEVSHLGPELAMLDREMYQLSWEEYEARQSLTVPQEQRIATTALRNAAYFAVALSLLDPTFVPPDAISATVGAELALIEASATVTISPLLDLPGIPAEEKLYVDYRQFAPSGRYALDPERARVFQAVTWHRAIPFRPDQREETRSAALMAHMLNVHPAPRLLLQRIRALLGFFQGQDASYTPSQYGALLTAAWGEEVDLTALADEERMDAFLQMIVDLPLPDHPIWQIQDARHPIDRDWLFLSRPFRVDGYILKQMTGDYVGDVENQRPLPAAIDLAAVLGSLEAYRVTSQTGDADYAGYIDQVDRVRDELSALRPEDWTGDLHWNWLYVYRSLLEEKTASFPGWMRTAAWKRKQLQSMFGSWVHVRHDDAWVNASLPPVPSPSTAPLWGYVEPQPEVYARLAALTRVIIDGLESRLMLSEADNDGLLELEAWLAFLQEVARRELTGQPLSDQEYQRLGESGTLIGRLTQIAAGGLPAGEPASQGELDDAVAVRIAAAQQDQLIEATGRVDSIRVVVERGGRQYVTRGGVYSHYEYQWPIEELLTDAGWRALLDAGEAPERPPWVRGFVVP